MKRQSGNSMVILGFGVLILLLPVLYVASAAPALRVALALTSRPGPDSERPMEVFHMVYQPLFSIAEATGTDGILRKYVLLSK